MWLADTVTCQVVLSLARWYYHCSAEDLLEVALVELGAHHDEARQLVEDLVELDVVLGAGEGLAAAQVRPQLPLAPQQLVHVPQEQLQLAYVARLLVLPDALHEYLVQRLEPGYEVPVHVLHLGVLGEHAGQVAVGVEVVVAAHQVLPQEDAGVEAAADLGVDLLGVVHELLQLLRQRHHALGEGGQQPLHQVQVLVVLAAPHAHRLPLEVVEGHLEVDLLEVVHEPLRLPLLVLVHECNFQYNHTTGHTHSSHSQVNTTSSSLNWTAVVGFEGQWQNINLSMLKAKQKAMSLELLSRHQERIRSMVAKISKYKPTYHVNKSYTPYDVEKTIELREEQEDRLFEENMKLIYRIETTGPKVETKKFPPVMSNARRLKTLQTRRKRATVKDVYRNEDELFEENIKIITSIECTGPKVECWRPKKLQSLLQQRKEAKQAEERKIMAKFKDISKEFKRLHEMTSTRNLLSNSRRTSIKTLRINRDTSDKSIRSITYKSTR